MAHSFDIMFTAYGLTAVVSMAVAVMIKAMTMLLASADGRKKTADKAKALATH